MAPNVLLGSVIDIKHGFAFDSEHFREHATEYLLLTPGNFHVDKRLYFGPRTKFYDGPIPDSYILENDDLLVVMTDLTKDMAILGNAVLLKSDKSVLHNQRIGLVTIKDEGQVDKRFLCELLNSDIIQRYIRATASGTTVRHTAPKRILEIAAPIPPLPEQKKIADILSTWDAAIEKTEALLATAKAQKHALMQTLLTGKRRFPEFEGQPWKEVRLGDVVKLSKKRLDPCKPHNALPCIELEHIEAESGRLLGSVRSDELKSIKAKFHPGDVLFGKLRPYLRKYLAPDFVGVCSTEIWVLCADHAHLRSDFLHCIVQSDGFMSEAEKSAGSKMPRSDWKVVAEYVVALPGIHEQAKIADAISVCDRETDDLIQNITKLRTEKKALMQQLLTGKRRVVV